MSSSFGRKSIIFSLEFLGLYTIIFVIIGLFHLSFAQIPLNIFGSEKYQLILSNQIISSAKWIAVCFLITLLIWIVRHSRDRWSIKDIGFKIKTSWGKDIWMGVVFFSLLFLVRFPLNVLVFPSLAELSSGTDFYNSLLTSSFPFLYIFMSFLFMALSSFGAAFWEEVLWRGYLQTLFTKKISPVTGFIMTAIIFGLGHYFTRPDWEKSGVLLALGVLLGGVFYGLAFYITQSLLVVGIMHFLSNICIDYPIMVYIGGNQRGAYMIISFLVLIALGVCLMDLKKIKLFWLRTKEIFISYGWKMIIIGIILGGIGVFYEWGKAWSRNLLQNNNPVLLAVILIVFSIMTMVLSFVLNKKGESND